ncbi:MAG: hypothetical protein M1820_003020 [Bogoriella megaspora]|nr:MAG: hypothetical protein M1820_003020 [Bogoriella megaspora]
MAAQSAQIASDKPSGPAIFSTNLGQHPQRDAPDPLPPVVAHSSPRETVWVWAERLMKQYPRQCRDILRGGFRLHDYFDGHDIHVQSPRFLWNVLDTIAFFNAGAIDNFNVQWSNVHRSDKLLAISSQMHFEEAFTQEEREIYGDIFLECAFKRIRHALWQFHEFQQSMAGSILFEPNQEESVAKGNTHDGVDDATPPQSGRDDKNDRDGPTHLPNLKQNGVVNLTEQPESRESTSAIDESKNSEIPPKSDAPVTTSPQQVSPVVSEPPSECITNPKTRPYDPSCQPLDSQKQTQDQDPEKKNSVDRSLDYPDQSKLKSSKKEVQRNRGPSALRTEVIEGAQPGGAPAPYRSLDEIVHQPAPMLQPGMIPSLNSSPFSQIMGQQSSGPQNQASVIPGPQFLPDARSFVPMHSPPDHVATQPWTGGPPSRKGGRFPTEHFSNGKVQNQLQQEFGPSQPYDTGSLRGRRYSRGRGSGPYGNNARGGRAQSFGKRDSASGVPFTVSDGSSRPFISQLGTYGQIIPRNQSDSTEEFPSFNLIAPQPSQFPITIPAGFNPDLHCMATSIGRMRHDVCELHIGQLPQGISEQHIKEEISKVAEVSLINLKFAAPSSPFRGVQQRLPYAFAHFPNVSEARKALEAFTNGTIQPSFQMRVQVPRRNCDFDRYGRRLHQARPGAPTEVYDNSGFGNPSSERQDPSGGYGNAISNGASYQGSHGGTATRRMSASSYQRRNSSTWNSSGSSGGRRQSIGDKASTKGPQLSEDGMRYSPQDARSDLRHNAGTASHEFSIAEESTHEDDTTAGGSPLKQKMKSGGKKSLKNDIPQKTNGWREDGSAGRSSSSKKSHPKTSTSSKEATMSSEETKEHEVDTTGTRTMIVTETGRLVEEPSDIDNSHPPNIDKPIDKAQRKQPEQSHPQATADTESLDDLNVTDTGQEVPGNSEKEPAVESKSKISTIKALATDKQDISKDEDAEDKEKINSTEIARKTSATAEILQSSGPEVAAGLTSSCETQFNGATHDVGKAVDNPKPTSLEVNSEPEKVPTADATPSEVAGTSRSPGLSGGQPLSPSIAQGDRKYGASAWRNAGLNIVQNERKQQAALRAQRSEEDRLGIRREGANYEVKEEYIKVVGGKKVHDQSAPIDENNQLDKSVPFTSLNVHVRESATITSALEAKQEAENGGANKGEELAAIRDSAGESNETAEDLIKAPLPEQSSAKALAPSSDVSVSPKVEAEPDAVASPSVPQPAATGIDGGKTDAITTQFITAPEPSPAISDKISKDNALKSSVGRIHAKIGPAKTESLSPFGRSKPAKQQTSTASRKKKNKPKIKAKAKEDWPTSPPETPASGPRSARDSRDLSCESFVTAASEPGDDDFVDGKIKTSIRGSPALSASCSNTSIQDERLTDATVSALELPELSPESEQATAPKAELYSRPTESPRSEGWPVEEEKLGEDGKALSMGSIADATSESLPPSGTETKLPQQLENGVSVASTLESDATLSGVAVTTNRQSSPRKRPPPLQLSQSTFRQVEQAEEHAEENTSKSASTGVGDVEENATATGAQSTTKKKRKNNKKKKRSTSSLNQKRISDVSTESEYITPATSYPPLQPEFATTVFRGASTESRLSSEEAQKKRAEEVAQKKALQNNPVNVQVSYITPTFQSQTAYVKVLWALFNHADHGQVASQAVEPGNIGSSRSGAQSLIMGNEITPFNPSNVSDSQSYAIAEDEENEDAQLAPKFKEAIRSDPSGFFDRIGKSPEITGEVSSQVEHVTQPANGSEQKVRYDLFVRYGTPLDEQDGALTESAVKLLAQGTTQNGFGTGGDQEKSMGSAESVASSVTLGRPCEAQIKDDQQSSHGEDDELQVLETETVVGSDQALVETEEARSPVEKKSPWATSPDFPKKSMADIQKEEEAIKAEEAKAKKVEEARKMVEARDLAETKELLRKAEDDEKEEAKNMEAAKQVEAIKAREVEEEDSEAKKIKENVKPDVEGAEKSEKVVSPKEKPPTWAKIASGGK